MKWLLPTLMTLFLFSACVIIHAHFGRDVAMLTALVLTWPNAFFAMWWINR